MKIVVLIKRFFAVFIFPFDSALARKRALSSLFTEIARRGPTWYNPRLNYLNDDFYAALLRAQRACARMSKVYVRVFGEGSSATDDAVNFVLDRALSESGLSVVALSFESIRAQVEVDQSADFLEAMDALFQARISALRSDPVARVASGFKTNQRLASLCRFAFDQLLNPFNSSSAKKKRKRHISAEERGTALADLHYLLSGLRLDADAKQVFLMLRAAADPEGYSVETAQEDLRALFSALLGPLRSEWIARAVMAIHLEPHFVFRQDSAEGDIRSIVLDRLSSEYAERRAIMADRMIKDALETRVRNIFAETPLLPISGWTEEISASLAAAKMPPLAGVQGLSIIKSFLATKYGSFIRPAISTAIVELDFVNRDVRTAFSDEADSAMLLGEDIAEFEQLVSAPGHSEFAKLIVSLSSDFLDAALRNNGRRLVEEANSLADHILQNAFGRFGALSSRLDGILSDLKDRSSILIANAPLINVRRSSLVKNLEESARLLALLQDLLNRVAVDSRSLRKSFSSAATK